MVASTIALVACACGESGSVTPNPWAGSKDPDAVGQEIERTDAAPEVLEKMRAAYRLGPDRRFVSALTLVDEMGAGVPLPEGAALHPTEAGWRVELDGAALGELEPYPDFLPLYGLVVGRAERLKASGGLAVESIDAARAEALVERRRLDLPASVPDARKVLREVEARRASGKLDAADLLRGARAWLVLELSLEDRMQVGDVISARAIAALALAEAALGRELRRERALLARHLGYAETAATLGGQLEAGDPVRHYARSEVAALAKAAKLGDPWIAWIYLDLASRTGHEERVRRGDASIKPAARRSLPAVAHLSTERWGDGPRVAYLARALIELELAAGERSSWATSLLDDLTRLSDLQRLVGTHPHQLIPGVEGLLIKLEKDDGGAYFDGAIEAPWHEAHVLSAIHELSHFYRDSLGAAAAAKSFDGVLAGASRPVLREGVDLQRVLMDAKGAVDDPRMASRLAAKISGLQRIGASGRKRLLSAAKGADPWSPGVRQAAQAWVAAADSRPAHRAHLHWIAHNTLLDLPLAEGLARSVARDAAADFPHTDLWVRRADDDRAAIGAMVEDESLSIGARVAAAKALREGGRYEPSPAVDAALRSAMAADPRSWKPVKAYADWLFQQGRDAEAKRAVQAWMRRPHDPGQLDELFAHSALARAEYQLGEYRACWTRMQEVARSMQYGTMDWAARCGAKAGDLPAAMAIARAAKKRYPSSPKAVLSEVHVHWIAGDMDAAARALVRANPPIPLNDFKDDITLAVHQAFPEGKDKEARAALEALAAAGLHWESGQLLGHGLHTLGRWELAVHLGERLKGARGLQQLHLQTKIYGWIRKHESKEAALEWLARRSPPGPARQPYSQMGFGERYCELPWDFVDDPPPGDQHGSYIWLVRTGCAVDPEGTQQPRWRERVTAHYAEKAPADFYDHIALMLLGQRSSAEIWSMAKAPDQKTEAAYFIAVEALARGEVELAIHWLRVTLELGSTTESESRWALNQLYSWRNKAESVERLRQRYAQPG